MGETTLRYVLITGAIAALALSAAGSSPASPHTLTFTGRVADVRDYGLLNSLVQAGDALAGELVFDPGSPWEPISSGRRYMCGTPGAALNFSVGRLAFGKALDTVDDAIEVRTDPGGSGDSFQACVSHLACSSPELGHTDQAVACVRFQSATGVRLPYAELPRSFQISDWCGAGHFEFACFRLGTGGIDEFDISAVLTYAAMVPEPSGLTSMALALIGACLRLRHTQMRR